mmetsp:Transcript_5015/g.8981  ORF Transcript_5015/g.8981 Transcript_5015/m.8981 type:complete len:92 (+) Transcript_5015:76-351(+)|eukprot:CAMPEP_0201890948 /NCGR_PEP_ID=MMETSP0902-20130614/33263_1 /ASSEMBLY_ACC=CAM_ASM_000551 /TAXON_ID=420261 /ORGANISM="Thalassiosira antarctica, Strain CCMP982" /LENGTH=91 /DNA_ID=CAMNT_0048421949 /DNA_START=45 /DNA_END=320 /DNA_ORIENTATION=+
MTMIASTALRNAARVGSRRQMSTAAPKTHKAKDAWVELQKTRPPPGHEHRVFEPPYSTPFVGAMVVGVLCTGYGMMYFGMRHQQYKQGYWK